MSSSRTNLENTAPIDADLIKELTENTMPGLSVDCVIMSFHDHKVKVLLNKLKLSKLWMLPGGLIKIDEDIDEAVQRVLYQRTGQENIKLRQFYLFGKKNRGDIESSKEMLESYGIPTEPAHSLMRRFATLGYLALVRHEQVTLGKHTTEDISQWFEIDNLPKLSHDHGEIINRALRYIRLLIDIIPIGYELLPEEFTIVELRKIYEGILGEELDKRNFRKKMINSGIIINLDKKRETDPYPQPILYSFDIKKVKELQDL